LKDAAGKKLGKFKTSGAGLSGKRSLEMFVPVDEYVYSFKTSAQQKSTE